MVDDEASKEDASNIILREARVNPWIVDNRYAASRLEVQETGARVGCSIMSCADLVARSSLRTGPTIGAQARLRSSALNVA
jgi:hypothetical protein